MDFQPRQPPSQLQESEKKEADFVYESVQDRESVLKYLRALIDGIESGSLELAMGDKSLTLYPSGLLDFEVNAKRRGSRVKLGLRIAWREDHKSVDDLRIFSP